MYLSDRQIEALMGSNICFDYTDRRPWVQDDIEAMPEPDVTAEEYAGFFVRTLFHCMGAFSYSWSAFPPFVTIGRYCSVAAGVEVMPQSHPTHLFTTSSMVYDPWLSYRKLYYQHNGFHQDDTVPSTHPTNNKKIIIGNDVYIGTNACLRSGITIGHGAIVGAYSVVTKDVPAYAVVVGNPARIVKFRYDQATIDNLLETSWWDYDFSQVTGIATAEHGIPNLISEIRAGALRPFKPVRHNLLALLSK